MSNLRSDLRELLHKWEQQQAELCARAQAVGWHDAPFQIETYQADGMSECIDDLREFLDKEVNTIE